MSLIFGRIKKVMVQNSGREDEVLLWLKLLFSHLPLRLQLRARSVEDAKMNSALIFFIALISKLPMKTPPKWNCAIAFVFIFRSAHEFVSVFKHCLDSSNMDIVNSTLHNLAEFCLLAQGESRNTFLILVQGSHSTWKTWKNESTPGKPGNIMKF